MKRPTSLARRVRAALALALALGLAAPAAASALNVFAASSLRDVFTQIDAKPTYNFAASNTLQLQIERGADADVFAAASPQEPQALFKKGKCARPVTFATNKLVLLVPKGNPGNIKSVYSLRAGGKKLAVGSKGVPIGDYTRALLRRLGLSSVLTKNTVSQESSVANVVSKVALGSADAGFAYVTDGRIAGDKVQAIRLPRYAQPPVRYQMCAVKASAEATAFIKAVRSDRGRGLLKAAGFGLPPKG
ncbi:MAG TPA: molybdate ABC transporter substrate-binding protein [Solirubrobacteraceae bacterium]|jgi:molybdate transport system substrate-binding protein|nr:molybdate ABC transporter substrate-binding protein [Solirubrobacteraceae bacterium]